MRRTRMEVRNAAIAMSAVAAAVALAGCGDDETHGDEQTLTYTEAKVGGFSAIGGASAHGTPHGTPPGGGFTIAVPLDDDSGSPAGELNAVCIATRESRGPLTGHCTGTADLQSGQLALEVGGKIADVTGSIVGGTGDYEGATGSFESCCGGQDLAGASADRRVQEGRATHTFTFTLP